MVETIREGDHIVEIVKLGEMSFRRVLNPKCASCKCFWEPNNDDIKPSGSYYKSCRKCRKPKMTAEQIREKDKERAKRYRERQKALML